MVSVSVTERAREKDNACVCACVCERLVRSQTRPNCLLFSRTQEQEVCIVHTEPASVFTQQDTSLCLDCDLSPVTITLLKHRQALLTPLPSLSHSLSTALPHFSPFFSLLRILTSCFGPSLCYSSRSSIPLMLPFLFLICLPSVFLSDSIPFSSSVL